LLGHTIFGSYLEFLERIIGKNQTLAEVIYYIGRINPNTGLTKEAKSKSRELYEKQEKFLKWLSKCGISYKLGYFQKDGRTEKGIDVKIAVDMIRLAYEDKYDAAFLISGDGDLVDAVNLVKVLGKKVYNVIFYKDKSFSYRLRQACGKYFYIDKQINDFAKLLLPHQKIQPNPNNNDREKHV